MLRGSSPIQLSQLDISPAIQAGALEAQAAVNLASSINKAIGDFQVKQEEKKQKEMTISALKDLMPGMTENVYKAAASNKDVRDSLFKAQEIQQQAEADRLGKIGYIANTIEDADERARYLESQGIIIPFDRADFEFSLDELESGLLEQVKANPDDEDAAITLYKLGVATRDIPSLLDEYRAEVPKEKDIKETVEAVKEKMTKEEEEQFLEKGKPTEAIKTAVKGVVQDVIAEDPVRGIQSFLNPSFLRGGFGD